MSARLSVCLSHAGILSNWLLFSNFFSPSGSHIILVFAHRGMAIFWQGPTHPNGGVECKGGMNNKLSCRRVTTRWFVLLNILLTHSRWLKVIRTGTIRNLGCGLLFAFHSKIWFYFAWFPRQSEILVENRVFIPPCIRRPRS